MLSQCSGTDRSDGYRPVMKPCSFISAMLILLPHVAATADTLPPVFVSTGGIDSSAQECDLAASSATAAAEASFRYNQVPVAQSDDFGNGRAIGFFINVSAFEIKRVDGSGTGTCAVDVLASLEVFTRTLDPVHQNIKLADVHYCDHGTLYTTNKFEAQRTLNDQITQYVNECVSTYQKIVVVK